MVLEIYRKLVPFQFRNWIYQMFLGEVLTFLRNFDVILKSKWVYLFYKFLPKNDKNKAYAFMGKFGRTSYPGEYMLKYENLFVEGGFDEKLGLPFVVHHSKRLYFPAGYSEEKVKTEYKKLVIEQDPSSAHRYVKSYEELKGKTLLDIGSADGNFALDTIEFTQHTYLFEYSEEWLAPLKATFAPWLKKVTIVPKYVDEFSGQDRIRLDEFIQKPFENLFIKMDVEGAELKILRGSRAILKEGEGISLAICTYHRPNDPEGLSAFMSEFGYSIEFTEGFIFWKKRLNKGILRSSKNTKKYA